MSLKNNGILKRLKLTHVLEMTSINFRNLDRKPSLTFLSASGVIRQHSVIIFVAVFGYFRVDLND